MNQPIIGIKTIKTQSKHIRNLGNDKYPSIIRTKLMSQPIIDIRQLRHNQNTEGMLLLGKEDKYYRLSELRYAIKP